MWKPSNSLDRYQPAPGDLEQCHHRPGDCVAGQSEREDERHSDDEEAREAKKRELNSGRVWFTALKKIEWL